MRRHRLLLHPRPHLFCSAAAAVWDLVVRRAWKEGREERASRNIFAKDGFWCARLGNRRLEHGIASTVGKWRRRRTTRDERTASHRSTSGAAVASLRRGVFCKISLLQTAYRPVLYMP